VAPVGVEEIDGADVAPELRLDGAGNVGESLGRIAAVRHNQAADLSNVPSSDVWCSIAVSP
jgi:hypothetical protein